MCDFDKNLWKMYHLRLSLQISVKLIFLYLFSEVVLIIFFIIMQIYDQDLNHVRSNIIRQFQLCTKVCLTEG